MRKQKNENIGWFIIGFGVAIAIFSILTFFFI